MLTTIEPAASPNLFAGEGSCLSIGENLVWICKHNDSGIACARLHAAVT